jgi:hypothetical protein
MNLQLNYMYRDYGNYKSHNSVIFKNQEKLNAAAADELVRAVLIDGMYFVAQLAKLPELFFKDFGYDSGLDHEWHEFDSFEETDAEPSDEHGRDAHALI